MACINEQQLEPDRNGKNRQYKLYRSSELLKPDRKVGEYSTPIEAYSAKKRLEERDPVSIYYVI